MMIILLVLGFVIIGMIVFRLIYRGVLRARHRIGSPGIDLMEMVQIGGIQQALYFRGQNTGNPVILFLHGGPASTEMQLLHGFQYGWEDTFTVVHWDQRQAGKTFLANNPKEIGAVTFDRMVLDAWEVTQYIQGKLGKDKIIVLGHSWGTILATALVQTYPQAFSAYISVGQITNWRENERIGYDFVRKKAKEAGNKKDLAKLELLGAYLTDTYDSSVFKRMTQIRNYQNKYGVGVGVDRNLILLALSSPYYSLKEVFAMFGNVWDYQNELFRYLFSGYDAESFGTAYTMPVFTFLGENDYVASRVLVESLYEKIQAPAKQIFFVRNAGHMTLTDNAKEFSRILLEEIAPHILVNKTNR